MIRFTDLSFYDVIISFEKMRTAAFLSLVDGQALYIKWKSCGYYEFNVIRVLSV